MRRFFLICFWAATGALGVLVFGILASLILSTFTSVKVDSSDATDASELRGAVVSDIPPDGELADAFSLFSSFTDAQRSDLERRISGKVVDWHLPVYDVTDEGDGEFVIQTSQSDSVGTFCRVRSESEADRQKILAIKSGDFIRCKGVIKGVTLRTIILEPAILN